MLLRSQVRRAGPVYQRSLTRCARTNACKRNFTGCTQLRVHDKPSFLLEKTKNIGIIAHIDAGKTTTTERMLYYSGYTRRIGDVDDGSTVTDFLPVERARGITIQSAAITFHWPPSVGKDQAPGPDSHTINLIDTPGHADFTFEVLRSLRILDGAVCILDGVAGVEAQTEKVWHQARTYSIPKIIYVNKLDRDGAAFGKTVKEIAAKLHALPAVCQIPWFESGSGQFKGVVDVVSLRALKWKQGGDGKSIDVYALEELKDIEPRLAEEAQKARVALVELLSGQDDIIVDKYLEEANEDHMAVSPNEIMASLRRCLLDPKSSVVPVYAGASFRNIGVQPLIDNITALLPNPLETPDPEIRAGSVQGGLRELIGGQLALSQPSQSSKKAIVKKAPIASVSKIEGCALAFKVVHDAKRGVLVYVRVYQGALTKSSMIFNTNLQVSERMPRLFKMYASDAVEVDSIPSGQIGVITGLKHARTGDTLITYTGANPKTGPPAPLNELQLRPIYVPPPVFFASIEPHSLSEEKPVADALSILLREDPSLQVSLDEDSGQTLLSGMGELHLEIARDRLIGDLKAKATMGKIEIGYREYINAASGPENTIYERDLAGKAGRAGCAASVEPLEENTLAANPESSSTLHRDGNIIKTHIQTSPETPLPSHLDPSFIRIALQNGALAALARGPRYSFPIHSAAVTITLDPASHLFGTASTPAAISAAARVAVANALRKSAASAPTGLMEPVMNVIISVNESSLGTVVNDITSARGGHVLSLDDGNSSAPDASVGGEQPVIDVQSVYAPPDPYAAPSIEGGEAMQENKARSITARVPLREMVGYLKVLRSHTGGRGTFIMSVDRFERMGSQREKVVLKELRGI